MNTKTAMPEGQLMRSIVNHLNQIQELILVRDELRALKGPGADFSALNTSIEAMVETLDPDAKSTFQRLFRKDHIVMAPMNNGSCAVCGMHLAIAQVQAVKLCQQIVTCPSCARIVFDPAKSSGDVRLDNIEVRVPALYRNQNFDAWPYKSSYTTGTASHQGWTINNSIHNVAVIPCT